MAKKGKEEADQGITAGGLSPQAMREVMPGVLPDAAAGRMEPGEAVQIGETLNPATHAADRMAAARAARKVGRKGRKPAPVPIGEMEWMLVGFKRDPYRAAVIGKAPNRFQLRKKWDAIRDLAAQNYDGVFVIRGKRYDVNSL